MKEKIASLVAGLLLVTSISYSQGDPGLAEAYKKVELQFAALKIATNPAYNYFLYTESLGTNARDVLINDNLKSGIFGSADNSYVVLYKPSADLEKAIRSIVPAGNIILITNSKIFQIMKSAMKATKDLYLLKFDASKRVNIAAKLAG